jgi:hypothetical protein
MLEFLLGNYLGVELVGHAITILFTLKETEKPPSAMWENPCQHLTLSLFLL